MYFNNKLKDGSELKYSAAQIHEKCLEVKKKTHRKLIQLSLLISAFKIHMVACIEPTFISLQVNMHLKSTLFHVWHTHSLKKKINRN